MMTDDSEVGRWLSHHGVLGMHWGSHAAKSSKNKTASTTKAHKLTRKDVKNERDAFYHDKINRLVSEATKNPLTLIALNDGRPVPTIVTGKEFIQHLSRGGLLNIKYTDVYATKQGDNYMLNGDPNPKFKRSDGK